VEFGEVEVEGGLSGGGLGGNGVKEGFPIGKAGILGEEELGFGEEEVVAGVGTGGALTEGVDATPDFGLVVGEGEGALVVGVEAVEGLGGAGEGVHPVLGELVVLIRSAPHEEEWCYCVRAEMSLRRAGIRWEGFGIRRKNTDAS